MKIKDKLKLVPKKYSAFLAIGIGAVILSPYAAYETGLLDRSTKSILTDIQQFDNCSFSYEINEKGVGKYGRYHNDITVLTCDLSAEQRKAQNISAALELEKSLQEEVKGINTDSKKELSDKIIARNARVDPETAIAQIAISSTSHHFESCELTKKDDKNSIECVVAERSSKDPKVTKVIEEAFNNMNIQLEQLDTQSVNKLAGKIEELRSKELKYKFADNKNNKPG